MKSPILFTKAKTNKNITKYKLDSLTYKSNSLPCKLVLSLFIIFNLSLTVQSQNGPACVSTNIETWLRADDGTASGASWTDYSGNANTATQGTGVKQPTMNASAINFNPALTFDGVDDAMVIPSVTLGAATLYIVATANNSAVYAEMSVNANANDGFYFYSGNFHFSTFNGTTGISTLNSTSGIISDGVPYILQSTHGGTHASHKIEQNGFNVSTASVGPTANPSVTSFTDELNIGSRNESSLYLDGDIAEIILYDRDLSAAEEQQVNSYLALKYGITIDQTVAQNYIASDGSTIMWDATINAAYNNDIAGVGTDIGSICANTNLLIQRQSKSVNTTAILTGGIANQVAASNATNTGIFPTDKIFLVWGNDGNTVNFDAQGTGGVYADVSAGVEICGERLEREWKVDKTGTGGDLDIIQLQFDLSAATGLTATTADGFQIMIDEDGDGDFTTGTVRFEVAASYSSNVLVFENLLLNDGEIFSLIQSVLPMELVDAGTCVGTVTSTDTCIVGDMMYFINPLDPTTALGAFKLNGNSASGCALTVDANCGVRAGTDYEACDMIPAGSAHTIMQRNWAINSGCAVSGGVDLIVPYDDAEITATRVAHTALLATCGIAGSSLEIWYKTSDEDVDVSLGTLTSTGLPNVTNEYAGWVDATVDTTTNATPLGYSTVSFPSLSSFSGFGWDVLTNDLTVLPVELISFTVEVNKDDCYTELIWQTAAEINSSHFEVEKYSDNGVWNVIGTVQANGNSTNIVNYSFIDNTFEDNSIYYYRLKEIDLDDSYEYSKKISTTISCIKNVLGDMVSIYPNPSNGLFTIKAQSEHGSKLSDIEIYDIYGQIIINKNVDSDMINLDLGNKLSTGIYIVITRFDYGKSIVQKIQVQ